MNLQEVTAVLSRTPETLRSLLEGLPQPWLETNEGEGTFSPRDVLGHLIHGEETDWVPRLRRILESGESRPFDPFDRTGFAIEGLTTRDLLAEFTRLRAVNLTALESFELTAEHLALKGLHPDLGPVTVSELLATWAVHDLNHIGQVVRVMSRRYDRAVGPWKRYLGILNR